MARWCEVCALTLTPMYPGDKAVMVLVDQHAATFGFAGLGYFDYRHIELIQKGTYNGYGWLDEAREPVRGEEEEKPEWLRTIFVHEEAWQLSLTEFSKEKLADMASMGSLAWDKDHKIPFEEMLFGELAAAHCYADQARRDILGPLVVKGRYQEPSQKEQRTLMALAEKILDEQQKQGKGPCPL